jgi:hypothetical protein
MVSASVLHLQLRLPIGDAYTARSSQEVDRLAASLVAAQDEAVVEIEKLRQMTEVRFNW